ncbi:hypothetical protein SAMN05660776_2915 [Salegentibacter holothuriorum]|uniref:Uncharacterized protein n=1 Tax=Salegentibacter holothuriorum TaxID=241145 RepID=A0A1T5DZT4_9FLAO|nr:hypothetical protein SAMN05660776_2915 [Salegentibacter holothuriorum]
MDRMNQLLNSLSWREKALLEEQVSLINYNTHEKSLKDEFSSSVKKIEVETS